MSTILIEKICSLVITDLADIDGFNIAFHKATCSLVTGCSLQNRKMSISAIHKAAGLMVPSCSMILTGTIPVEHKSVHWQSMGAAGRNHLWGLPAGSFWGTAGN